MNILYLKDHLTSSFTFNGNKELYRYNSNKILKIIPLILVIGGILAALGVTGHLPRPSFRLIPALGIPTLLMIGGTILIYRNRSSIIGHKLSDDPRWISAGKFTHYDLSQIDAGGNGKILVYRKSINHIILTGIGLALIMPIYVACVIVYNLLRFAIVPFYILIRMIQEKWKGKPLYPKERTFRFSDIPIEMGRSLWRVFKAPFYGTALFYAALKATIDPLNALKEGAAIESDWNEGVPLYHQGIWMWARAALDDWKWEGGGGPQSLGKNGFYAAGSWQPIIAYIVKNWKYEDMTEIDGSDAQFERPYQQPLFEK